MSDEVKILVRLDPGLNDALREAAKTTVRSRNGLIQFIVKEWLEQAGYLQKKEDEA